MLTQKRWSPYFCGMLIGLLQIPAFLLIDTALGTSSSFVWISGKIGQFVPALNSEYVAKDLSKASSYWQVFLGIGVILGTYISSRMGKNEAPPVSPFFKQQGFSYSARMVLAFSGGFIILFGARLAGGCTSGHGLSGVAQLSIGSLVATGCMFIGAIIVANILYRR